MLKKKLLAILSVFRSNQVTPADVASPITTDDTHIFVKREGSTISVYVNNVLVRSGTINAIPLEMDSDNLIGASHFNSNALNGELRNLHFYNYALGDVEREAIYTRENE